VRRLLALAAAVVLGLADEARACTPAALLKPTEPRAVVGGGDAAFVGRLVNVRRLHPLPVPTGPFPAPVIISPGDPAIFTFRVDERIKGNLPEVVDVLSAGSSAICGLSHRIGVPLGLLLHFRNGGWHASMFDEYEPDVLRLGRRSLRHRMV
jgi:hypothetical protein